MEPEVPYIPYAERSAKELCRDILLKAEKLYIKNDKRNLLLIGLLRRMRRLVLMPGLALF